MILITGANGHLGKQVINFLQQKDPALKIAGLVRSKEKGAEIQKEGIELRIGDYTNTNSLQNALKEVETLLLISSSNLENRITQHVNAINAAKAAGVKHIIYTSISQAHKRLSALAVDHIETEEAIKASGIPYTILRNTFYSEYFESIFLGNAIDTGDWYYPANGAKLNFANRTEMAEALANVLLEPTAHLNKTYEITSLNAYSFPELAAFVSKAAGKEIKFADIPMEAFKDGLDKASLPGDLKDFLTDNANAVSKGALENTTTDLETLLGRKPQDFSAFIHQHYAQVDVLV
ncbi:MAG: SDR family oxidoreductase [Ferruginibacter sp.]